MTLVSSRMDRRRVVPLRLTPVTKTASGSEESMASGTNR
jgi:hypothetical protein